MCHPTHGVKSLFEKEEEDSDEELEENVNVEGSDEEGVEST